MMLELICAEGVKLKRLCRWMPVIQGMILVSMTALEWYLYFRQGPGGSTPALQSCTCFCRSFFYWALRFLPA